MFNLAKTECPRCLGKGIVDLEDIKRLKRQLKWEPGECAYCSGKGVVKKSAINNVAVDTTYLSIDIDTPEHKRLLNGDRAALERAEWYELKLDLMIEQIRFLSTKANMDSTSIAEFFKIGDEALSRDEIALNEFRDYVERIIENKDET